MSLAEPFVVVGVVMPDKADPQQMIMGRQILQVAYIHLAVKMSLM
jgi:hypothetical protein